jgi:hypothetical protein
VDGVTIASPIFVFAVQEREKCRDTDRFRLRIG